MNRSTYVSCLLVLSQIPCFANSGEPPPTEAPSSGTTHLESSSVSIDLNLELRRPEVAMRVNGQGPYRFVVDTGASLSVIDEEIADELGLEVVGKQVLRSPGSSEFEGNRVQVERLAVGGLRIDQPVLATMALRRFSRGTIDGVLGRPHFQEFLLTFDYPAAQLLVTRGSLERTDPATLDYNTDHGSIRIPVDVSGVSVPMVLDTGSPGGFTLPKAMESHFRFLSTPQPGPTIRLVGGEHKTWMGTLDGAILLGETRYETPSVKLGTFGEDFGNIGFGVLRELRVTVDQAASLVRLERAVPSSPNETGAVGIAQRGGPVRIGGPSGKPQLGLRFQMTPEGFVEKDGGFIVEHVIPDGPAHRAGLMAGDVVQTIAGRKVTGLDVMAIAQLVQGPRPLEIDLLRQGERRTLAIDQRGSSRCQRPSQDEN